LDARSDGKGIPAGQDKIKALISKMMTEKIIIAGAGGQGIMLLGKVLAEAALREGKYISWFPSYGAEVRGGTANCMVVISQEEIPSPYIEKANTMVIMNQPSWVKFKNRISPKGLFILNASLMERDSDPTNAEILKYPFTQLAVELGNIKVANMIALGALIAKKRLVSPQTVIDTIEAMAPPGKRALIEINKKALRTGIELIR
jgi:2-oxoglutarate ferredoxin oxidoreductase subunit gamma